ncbi:hypothetical protein MTR67_043704 [Solanum verrucosum]|uniref:Uncharacterized protein n=1 Tax=Solanum verrucosum TaxID=315347 RepID=A0AAF0UQT5_SOLVR|nr:hypothetical protein MTR67_043704 [Solanum verrucosum]
MSDCMFVPINVSTLVAESLVVDQVYWSYLISLVGYDTRVNLIILAMVDFDIIFGMDLLSPHHVILDCYIRTVNLAMPGVPRVEWMRASCFYPRKNFKETSGLTTFIEARSSLVEQICQHKFDDQKLCLFRDKVMRGQGNETVLDSDGVLRIECRIYVPKVSELIRLILEEAYCS